MIRRMAVWNSYGALSLIGAAESLSVTEVMAAPVGRGET